MSTISDYEAWEAKRQRSSVNAANVVLTEAIQVNPDEAAKDHTLALAFGAPTPLVSEYRSIFEQKLQAKRNSTILSSSPKLSAWLMNEDNARVAHDDLGGLSWFEGAFTAAGNSLARGGLRVEQGVRQYAAEGALQRSRDVGRSFGEILEETSQRPGPDGTTRQAILPTPTELAQATVRFGKSRFSSLLGLDEQEIAADQFRQVGEITKRIQAIPMSGPAERFKGSVLGEDSSPAAGLMDALGTWAVAIGSDPLGAWAFVAETAGEMAPQLAAATAATIATRNPAAGAGVMMGSSYATERFTSPAEFIAEKGIDLSTPEGVSALLANPALVKEAADRGVIRGVIIGALDGLSGGLAGKQLARSRLGDALVQSIVQGVLGASGEAGAQAATDGEIDWNEVILEGLAEFATTPVELVGVGGKGWLDARQKAKSAEARSTFFSELSGNATNSKLRARMPKAFRDFLASATADGPVENLFVPADKFVSYFQSAGLDVEDVATELGLSLDEFEAAVFTGGDVQIPTAAYASALAGSEHDAFFLENMRLSPDEMTAAEAREFNEKADEALQEAFDLAEEVRRQDEELRSFETEIFDTVVSRLRAAGRATDVARAEAALYPAFYRTIAERTGFTTEELMRRFPIPGIERQFPEGLQPKNVDEFVRTLAEVRRRKATKTERQIRGPSLLDYVREMGIADGSGDAQGGMFGRSGKRGDRGEVRQIVDGIKRKPGQRNILRADGATVEDAARRAIEAGYMADDPIVLEYQAAMREGRQIPDIVPAFLEALDRDARADGVAVFTADAEADAVAEREAMLDDVEAYLADIGADLDMSDDDIRRMVEQASAGRADGRAYAQPANGSGTPYGMIRFPEAGIGNGETVIQLFERANLSTFIHETGHYFLAMFQAMATGPNAVPELAADWQILRDWWSSNAAAVAKDGTKAGPTQIEAADVLSVLERGTTGDAAKDAAVDVGMQEQWARAFEAYTMEGKAPSIELRGAFERFRAWLLNLYRRVTGLGVNVSDDVRRVMDRMLATDQEIEAARSSAGDGEMLFKTAEEAGVTPAEYAALVKLHEQARDAAAAELLRDTMAPIRREREKWFKEERAKVRAKVEERINRMPVYRAVEWMGNRRWLGVDEAPEGIPDLRMSRAVLVDRYGEGVLDTLPRGFHRLYTDKAGGMDPDEVAGWFGFGSGDEMVQALEQAQKRAEAIEAETDREMMDLHGDVLADGSVEDRALQAVHSDTRGRYLAAELGALLRRPGGRGTPTTASTAREIARRTIARMKVRDAIRPGRFLAAERKAGRDAEIAAAGGDFAAAAEAKRRQLLNHSLYAEAVRARDDVEAIEKVAARLGKKSTRDKLAGDYLEAIDEILERYDFRKLGPKAEAKRGAVQAYIQMMTEAGRENELALPDYVIRDAKRTPYKTLSMEYLRGVGDSLRNIEHTARLKKKLVDAKRQRELDAVVEDILDAFEKNVPVRAPGRVATTGERVRAAGRQFLDIVLSADTLLREIDGFGDKVGAAYRNIKQPIDEAMSGLVIKRREAAEAFDKIYSVYTAKERRQMADRVHYPELDGSFSRWELIAMALNMGNEDNLQRLTDDRVIDANGRRLTLTEAQVEFVKRTLTERDWKFVQSAWDMVNSYWSEIEARERRVTGVAPKKVEAMPVVTPYGTFRGGYYPIKYDARLSATVRDEDLAEITKSMQAGRFGKAQTRNGHLKERAASSGRPVSYDIGVMHGHVNQVVHDLALSEVVANSWRILQDPRIKGQFIASGRQADFDALEIWLQDVAAGEQRSADIVSKSARRLKSGFTVSKLAFKVSTALLQVTGIAQSIVVVGRKDFAAGYMDMFRRPLWGPNSMTTEVIAKSPFMAERQTTFQKDIYDLIGDTRSGPSMGGVGAFMRETMIPLAFWMMQKVQFYAVDLPTWLAGYRKGLRNTGSEADAIAYADRVVARAAASGLFSDRTAIERGSLNRNTRQSDVVRLFTTLGSYMFAKFNVAYTRTMETDFRRPGQVLGLLADFVMLFTVEAVLASIIKGRLPDEEDDDDGDGMTDEWMAFLAGETAASVGSTIPFVRDMVGAAQGFGGGGAYGSIMETMTKPFAQAAQGEVDKSLIKSWVDLGGMFLMFPSAQFNASVVDPLAALYDGEDIAPIEFVLGKSK